MKDLAYGRENPLIRGQILRLRLRMTEPTAQEFSVTRIRRCECGSLIATRRHRPGKLGCVWLQQPLWMKSRSSSVRVQHEKKGRRYARLCCCRV